MSENETQRRAFWKRTRKGKVVRVVNERYIRDDVGCGYMLGSKVDAGKLVELVQNTPSKDLLVLDTNIALQEIDVLEYKCPATGLVVVLQTVLQELKHLNKSVYQRIKSLIENESMQYIFFPNELETNTATMREHDETINDANDRAIRHASKHLHSFIESSGCRVVLLSEDVDMQKKAKKEELACVSMRAYLNAFLDTYPELADLLAASVQHHDMSDVAYPQHLSMDEISAGLRTSKVLRGSLRCQARGKGKNNWTQCYVVVHGDSGRRFVDVTGAWRVNRAVDGDVVAIEILPSGSGTRQSVEEERFNKVMMEQTQTSSTAAGASVPDELLEPSAQSMEGLALAETKDNSSNADNSSNTDNSSKGKGEEESSSSEEEKLSGRVVGIIRRNWRQYAGSLSAALADSTEVGGSSSATSAMDIGMGITGDEDVTSCLFQPVDGRIPSVSISTRRREALQGHRILVAIDSWPASSKQPLGHYVQTLGKDGDKAVETQVLLHEFDVPHEAFTPEVMACLPPEGWKITEEVVAQRTDLRHIPVVSIDPPGCKDIDDALHCVRLPNGRLEAGVHIADVTFFVHPDTPLDKEAAHRATSTYLVERRLDMLPGLLTTELCSLRANEDHLAFSVLWEFDDDGNIYDVRFCKSVIHSVAALTYDEAQAMLDDDNAVTGVAESVKLLNKLARILRQRRIDEGALTLASPEVRFKLDIETQNPTDVSTYALKQANALVEEWMLLGNITVSKKVLRHYPTLGLLRRHQPPSREQFAPLVAAAQLAGVHIDISSSKALADSLDLAVKAEDPYFNKLLRIMSTRCMMPAQYFCSGEVPKEQWHHYGLAAPVYTHFTSPIRRYADVIVHRLLASAIGVIPLPAGNADRSRQQELSSHLNRRHKAAQYVQRASVNLHTLLFFKNKPSVEQAYILSITKDAIAVLVPRFGIEGSVNVQATADALGCVVDFEESMCGVTFSRKGGIKGKGKSEKGEKEVNNINIKIENFQAVDVRIQIKDADSPNRYLDISLAVAVSGSGDGGADSFSKDSKDSAIASKMREKTDVLKKQKKQKKQKK